MRNTKILLPVLMEVRNLIGKVFNTNGVLLIANLLLLFCFFGKLESIGIANYFNSDTLYLPSVYRDLFIDKTGLEGWHFNPAPNFFPDMLLYFVLMCLAGNNFIIASFVFSILQYFVLFYVLVAIFKKVLPGLSPKFYAIIFLVQTVWFMEFFYPAGNFLFSYLMLVNAYHTGIFILSLCCFLFVMKAFNSFSTAHYVLLFVLIFLGVFSDRLFITAFVAPVILSFLFFIRIHRKPAILIIFISTLATILSFWAFELIADKKYIYFEITNPTITGEAMTLSYNYFTTLMKEYLCIFGFRSVGIYLFIASFLGLIFLLFKNRRSSAPVFRFFLVFMVLQSVVVICGPIVSGNFGGQDTIRYNIYPLYLTGLNLAVFGAVAVKRSGTVKKIFHYATICATVCLLAAGLNTLSFTGLDAFFNYYPDVARRLDEVAEKEGLLQGVGNYWFAKNTTMFSKKGVKVRAVFDDLAAYEHVVNDKWFFDNNNKFNFVLLNNIKDTTLYGKRLSNTKLLYSEENFKLVKSDVFVYDRATYNTKNN